MSVNFMLGTAVNTASTILGRTPNSAVMGQTLVSASSGMTTPIFICSGAPSSVNTGATEFIPFKTNLSSWAATAAADQPCATAGIVSTLYVLLETAPGAGKSWTYTLYKNGVATALTVTISDAATSGNDTGNSVTVAAGDLLSWGAIPAGTPTAPTNLTMSCKFVGTTAGESVIFSGSNAHTLNTGSNSYIGINSTNISGSVFGTDQAIASSLISAPGVFDKLYINLTASPGSGKSYAFTIIKNGSSTGITCTISDLAIAASDLTHTLSVAAGDTISLEAVPSGTPSARNVEFSMRFVPTTAGESLIGASGTNPSTSSTRFFRAWGAQGSGNTTALTTVQGLVPVGCTLKNLYTAISTAPGVGASRTSRSYVNAGYGTLSAAISGNAATTANDTTHSDALVLNDVIWWATDPASSPAAVTHYKFGATLYIAP